MWNVSGFEPPKANSAVNLTLGAGAVPMIFTTPPVVTSVAGPNGQEAFIFHYNFDTDASAPFDPRVAQNFPAGGTRPLGAYSGEGRYKGTGSTKDAANFACVIPQAKREH